MQAIQVNLLAKLVPIDVSTLVLVQVIREITSLIFGEEDAQHTSNAGEDFISVH